MTPVWEQVQGAQLCVSLVKREERSQERSVENCSSPCASLRGAVGLGCSLCAISWLRLPALEDIAIIISIAWKR